MSQRRIWMEKGGFCRRKEAAIRGSAFWDTSAGWRDAVAWHMGGGMGGMGGDQLVYCHVTR